MESTSHTQVKGYEAAIVNQNADRQVERALEEALVDSARSIGASTDRQQRVTNMATYLVFLGRYMTSHHIDLASQVDPIRRKKAVANGVFKDRMIRTVVSSDGKNEPQDSKLVRDKLIDPNYGGVQATFFRANDQEFALAVDEKIVEETQGLIVAADHKKPEEIADSLEALSASRAFNQIEEDVVERARQTLDVQIRRAEREAKREPKRQTQLVREGAAA